ncbi:hypothetical protein ACIBHX_40615 [Nonomuraea sp. NPDC050536]|uniref:hypothetical protein n=1 Tax=Nonomuraea sp. NPDC050536 TaxID=3364366 RepID=UPI0037CB4A67
MSSAEIARIRNSLKSANSAGQLLGTPFADELEQLAENFAGCVSDGGFNSSI